MKGGLLSADDTRESEQSRSRCATRAAASADGRRIELRGGGRGSESTLLSSSSSPAAERGAAADGTGAGVLSAGSPAEWSRGKRPKRVRKSPIRFRDKDEPSAADGTASCGSARGSGKLVGARVPTPITASRMGLDKSADAFEEGGKEGGGGGRGGGIGDGGGDKTPCTTPHRDLEQKFHQEHVSGGEASDAALNRRAKRTAAAGADIGELDWR